MLRLKPIFLLLFMITSTLSVDAQRRAKNAIYAEIGGNGLFYSINYDRQIYAFNESRILGMRLGYGGTWDYEDYLWDDDLYLGFYNFPIEVYLLFGKSKHYFDVGYGVAPSFGKSPTDDIYHTDSFINVSYRFQPRGGGLFIKSGLLVQSFNIWGGQEPIPWARLALGYAF